MNPVHITSSCADILAPQTEGTNLRILYRLKQDDALKLCELRTGNFYIKER